MRPFIGGLTMGLGLILIVFAAIAGLLAKHGIYSIGHGINLTPSEAKDADRRGRASGKRLAAVARKGIYPGLTLIVVGIVVAAV